MTVDYCNPFEITCNVLSYNQIQIEGISNILHRKFPMYEFTISADFEHIYGERGDYSVLIYKQLPFGFDTVLHLEHCYNAKDIIRGVENYLNPPNETEKDKQPTDNSLQSIKTKVCTCPNCGANKHPQDSLCSYCGTTFY